MSVRVIRGGDSTDVPLTPAVRAWFEPTVRRIDAERWRARLEGEAIVAEAKKQADGVREAARAEGMQQGRREALAIVAKARAAESSLVDGAIEVVVSAARAVAERAVARSIAVDDAALAGWAREALSPLQGARRIVVRGAPSSIERLRKQLQQLSPRGVSLVELAVDASLPDDVLHARSDVGEVKLDVTTQVAAMVELVRDAIAQSMRGKRG